MKKELEILGLTNNEALVYEVLVRFGPCKAGLVIRKLEMHRTLVYRALESLVANGYSMKFEKRGVWYFQITDPYSLLTNMRRRERVFGEVIQEIQKIQQNTNQRISVFEGVESYRNYWFTALERAPDGVVDYVAGGDLKTWLRIMGTKADDYLVLARKKHIVWKTLYFNHAPDEFQLLKKSELEFECRMWVQPPRAFCGNFNVFHNTVILHTLLEPPRIIEIRDEALLIMFKNYFDMMWESAEPVKL